MKFSIVIPVINESTALPLAIKRAWDCGAFEVIIVDGGSSDGTPEIALKQECVLVSSPPGRGQQMNAGARVANGDVLIFLHADNWLVERGCEQIKTAFETSTKNYGGFKQRIDNEAWIYRWLERGNTMRGKWQGLLYGDQALFVKRELFQHQGGFPEIEIMEDFAFSRILSRTGKPLILEGPTHVSDRRWKKNGVIRQTVKNWFLSAAFRLGASPQWIARRYRRHDK